MGMASWYGYPYHGQHAASGEIYDMEQLTAAHRTLPFGTVVRVVNLKNDKSVDVRINDRGPFINGRIIDLSKAAAREVDILGPGVGAVRLELLDRQGGPSDADPQPDGTAPTPVPPASGTFAVQVGAFRERRNAERYVAEMRTRYGSGRIVIREGDPIPWRVWVGSEATVADATALAARVRQELAVVGAFVTRLD